LREHITIERFVRLPGEEPNARAAGSRIQCALQRRLFWSVSGHGEHKWKIRLFEPFDQWNQIQHAFVGLGETSDVADPQHFSGHPWPCWQDRRMHPARQIEDAISVHTGELDARLLDEPPVHEAGVDEWSVGGNVVHVLRLQASHHDAQARRSAGKFEPCNCLVGVGNAGGHDDVGSDIACNRHDGLDSGASRRKSGQNWMHHHPGIGGSVARDDMEPLSRSEPQL